MNTVGWIILGVVVFAVIVLLAMAARWRSGVKLQERFGPEYDREVAARGNEREARRHLREVANRRDQLDIRQLDAAARDRYTERWQAVQTDFVDQPRRALDEADRLVTDVMQDRGYPVGDFDERAELVAADHPEVVEHYRAAHAARQRQAASPGADGHTGDTEELRQAFVHYRALFEELVHDR
jgi:type II secretory pathway component PulK